MFIIGDPRTRYGDASLRPWFVVFDGDAAQARVAALARAHASVASADWSHMPKVVGLVDTRG
jgi:hypothetical protein